MNEHNLLGKIPDSWCAAKLGEIAIGLSPGFPCGKHNKQGIGVPHLRPMNILSRGEISLYDLKYVEASDYTSLKAGDILFNNTNSPALLGKTSYIRQDTNWAFSNHMTRIQVDENNLSPAWIARYLHYLFETGYFMANCTNHVNQASINTGFLSTRVRVPIPPLSEQHRIVDKIEELFTQLDVGIEELRKAQAQLKRYRQAVLKAAVTGELTKEWRERTTSCQLVEPQQQAASLLYVEPAEKLLARILNERRMKWEADQVKKMKASGKTVTNVDWKARYREPQSPDLKQMPALPAAWQWARLDALALIKGGITKDSKRKIKGRLVPYLRVANVQRGYLDLSIMKEIKATKGEILDLKLEQGDVLFTEGGDRDKLGRGWVWNDELPECIHQNHIFRGRLYSKEMSARFISFFSNTCGLDYFLREGKQTTNLASINMTKLSGLPVPVPPAKEQEIIVSEIERCISIADALLQTIEQSLKQAERIRQSILKQAFEGKLVPQDPNDEPAEVLLERIKAERVEREAQKRAASKLNGPRSRKNTKRMRTNRLTR